ncbi:MAG: Si-specific NAD(P)(+) transhydrogenase [gamma proteobacterium symbiont of Bathyaustriella thionipta]|nr:Si-specific NAD(P)(+) transhydrogenase [gamma proteobacterium symbiont of Bathyaustriella thionipta]
MTYDYDVVVIGSGPGGEGAAMNLSKAGKRVAMVERSAQVGGSCTHSGTIPSKMLRHSVQLINDYRHNPLFARTSQQFRPEYPDLLKAAGQVIQQQVATRYRYYDRNRVTLLQGQAEFESAEQLCIRKTDGSSTQVSAKNFVIATGSRPYHPPDMDFSDVRIHDSDSILSLRKTPSSICIYGAGVIGCEYASIFSHLGLKVDLINTRDRLMSFLDDEITDALSYHLSNEGATVRNNEEYDRVESSAEAVILHLKSGKQIRADILLWANGRSGNSADMGLSAIGVEINPRQQIVVNENFQTALAHIYALGDVIGPPGLASASYDQGRFVGAMIANGKSDWHLVQDVPTGIYTLPEISSIGRSERELTEACVPYEVGRAKFSSIARAQITGHTVGMLKILFHRETLEILGIHCFGEQASEIIHIGQAIMSQSGSANSIRYFAETTFNYPTMAEAWRTAALNGLNRLS